VRFGARFAYLGSMHNITRFKGLFFSVLMAGAAPVLTLACAVEEEAVADDAALTKGITGAVAIGENLITTTRVNFREEPNTSSTILRLLAKGTPMKVLAVAPDGAFYNVENEGDEGWVHGGYLSRSGAPAPGRNPGPTPNPTPGPGPGINCMDRRLVFSADSLPGVPGQGAAIVWGGNATSGSSALYGNDFLGRVSTARARGIPTFAYLEGPCGDTGGVDDGERARCASAHNDFNQRNAPGTPNTAKARWKPYTLKQMTESGRLGIDYCEIDNLTNQVTIPLNPLAREIKALYDAGKIHCRLVLKNVEAGDLDSLREEVAPTIAAANFIAPFHIFEAEDTSAKSGLDAAMVRLKGPGAKTIVSTDTNHYGSAFTNDKFKVCD
jgi:hypothetical protein